MTHTLQAKRDEMAIKYGDSRGGTFTTKQGSYAYTDFQAGWDALHAELLKGLEPFDEQAVLKEAREWVSHDPAAFELGYLHGNKAAHEQSALQIAALGEEISGVKAVAEFNGRALERECDRSEMLDDQLTAAKAENERLKYELENLKALKELSELSVTKATGGGNV